MVSLTFLYRYLLIIIVVVIFCLIFFITGASVPTLPDFVPPELGLNRQCGIDLNLTLSGVKEGKEWALKSIYLFNYTK